MKHNWKKNSEGEIDEYAWNEYFCSGPVCLDCGRTICVYCHSDWYELDDCTGKEEE